MPKNKLSLDVIMPVYNAASIIGETLDSILAQSFKDFRLIIVDDCSTDGTEKVVQTYAKKDTRIKYYRNEHNLGYSKNIEKCRTKATSDIIYLMGQDDILASGALQEAHDILVNNSKLGAITRPYFWFDPDVMHPVRAKQKLDPNKNTIVKISDDYKKLVMTFATLDQFSGLVYRRSMMEIPFHEDIFPCHVYPFAHVLRKHPVMFLKDHTIAVRISSSQTRSLSSIYEKSPLLSWVQMFENVYPEQKYAEFREYMIKNFVARNYVGLIQIRNYGKYSWLLREIWYLIKFRPANLFSLGFWFFSLGTMLVPPALLIKMVDVYKRVVYSFYLKRFGHIDFKYDK